MERSDAGSTVMQAALMSSIPHYLPFSVYQHFGASVPQANRSGCAMYLPSRMMRTIAAYAGVLTALA